MLSGLKHLAFRIPPIQRLRDRRDALEREVAALARLAEDLSAERDGLSANLEAAVRRQKALAQERDAVLRDVTALVRLRDELVALRDELARRNDELAAERDDLAAKLRRSQGLARLHRNTRTFPDLTPEQIADYKKRITQYADGRVRWFHSIDLGHGLKTDGVATAETLRHRLEYLEFPDDLTGLTFLDIASWDGFYAFEAEARGAARVLATDYFCWHGPGWGKKRGFLLAREILQSKVEDMDIEPHDISPEAVGTFDVVLFSGIFYHLRDPLKALEAAASVTKKLLIVETHVGFENVPEPVMGYLPRVANNRHSNYWRPNSQMIRLLLTELGFTHIEQRIHGEPGTPLERHGFWNAYR